MTQKEKPEVYDNLKDLIKVKLKAQREEEPEDPEESGIQYNKTIYKELPVKTKQELLKRKESQMSDPEIVALKEKQRKIQESKERNKNFQKTKEENEEKKEQIKKWENAKKPYTKIIKEYLKSITNYSKEIEPNIENKTMPIKKEGSKPSTIPEIKKDLESQIKPLGEKILDLEKQLASFKEGNLDINGNIDHTFDNEIEELTLEISELKKEKDIIEKASKQEKKKKIKKHETGNLDKIAELLKNKKIDQIIIHAQESEEPGLDKGLTFNSDLDTQTALWFLNNLNKKSIEETYGENAMSSLIPKGGSEKNLREERGGKEQGGLRIFLDVGGTWLKIEDGDKTTTIHIDHHGEGRGQPTSASEMVYKIMDKAGLLKEKPAWINEYLKFVKEFDNLTYLFAKNENGEKIFNKEYYINTWPQTIYALAEKIPTEDLMELFKNRKIDPKKPLSESDIQFLAELNKNKKLEKEKNSKKDLLNLYDKEIKRLTEELKSKEKSGSYSGEELEKLYKNLKSFENLKTKTESTKDLTEQEYIQQYKENLKKESAGEKVAVLKTIDAIGVAENYAKKEGLNLNTSSLGRVVYHNFPETKRYKSKKDGQLIIEHNKIINSLGFITTRAENKETYICWDKQNGKFFINSFHPNLSEIVKLLNKADPNCAIDVRGTMVFGKINNLTERQFLDIIDPNILKKNKENKEPAKVSKEQRIKELEAELKEITKDMPSENLDDLEKFYEDPKNLEDPEFQKAIEEGDEAKIKEIEKKLFAIFLSKQPPKEKEEEPVITKEDKKDSADTEPFLSVDSQKNKKPGDVLNESTDKKNIAENKERKIFSFDIHFIENKILEIIKGEKIIKKIEGLSITAGGNNDLNLSVQKIVAKSWGMTSEITLNKAHIINTRRGITIDGEISMSATKFEKRVKNSISENMNKLDGKVKETLEKETGRRLQRIWIENGELKAR